MSWSWNVATPAMLWGLLGVAIPVLIHLLSRRRATVVDWGAMQFLDLGQRAHRHFQITEMLLMLGRMGLLALLALAVARPFWQSRSAQGTSGESGIAVGASDEPRDVVLILDGSDSMGRQAGGTTPRREAIAWARRFVGRLPSGSHVAVLDARNRVRPMVVPPRVDKAALDEALKGAPEPRGSSDLPSALAEALHILEQTRNTARDIVVLTDGQRFAWKPSETARWTLLRDLYREGKSRRSIAPRIWSVAFGTGATPEGADGAVGPLELSRGLAPPGLPIEVSTTVTNAGPEPLTRTVDLLVDGVPVPGASQKVGPIPPGGTTALRFREAIGLPGAHLLTVRLEPGNDPLPANDEASRPIEVAEALPVLLVDGEPGIEPFGGETDFLRAALSPADDEAPAVRTSTVTAPNFSVESLKNQRVLVLANVERLEPAQTLAVSDFLADGGGVLVLPGDRTDITFWNENTFQGGSGWLPASLGEARGDVRRREVAAHPDPRRFGGSMLSAFGQGESPPLGRAGLFAYRVLEPATTPTAATVMARLDTGDPWIVERAARKGRVIVMAGPLDAEGGTLAVNPDFVPLVHSLIFYLADPTAGARPIRPGEPIRLDLAAAPPVDLKSVAIRLPDGRSARGNLVRQGPRAEVRFDDTAEPGVYRIDLPDPPGGTAQVVVEADGRETDPTPLDPAEASTLAKGWPLVFETEPGRLPGRLLDSGGSGPHPIWRGLILAALGGLCLEVWATRRLARSRGLAEVGGSDTTPRPQPHLGSRA